ncbi:D-xylose transport ATP-binding protein XylG [Klebsiella pneumoniae]|uniref:D-xylose transport ATP-binding protein XylG n=1 Tax=Klebsiella pneumoniae TaxID=573 RepID=A0A4P0YID6_KLEPN|nr:D-xylose transport ATP-binding protein XylG [Klebsiella pneumoniae]
MSSLDDAAEQHCIQQSIQRLKIKTSSPELAIGRLSGGNQQKRFWRAVCCSIRAF